MSDYHQSFVGTAILRILALLFILFGIALAGGGGYLISLHGSPYYLLTGLAVLVSGILLMQCKAEGAALYGYMLFATVVWAVWESGFNWWALAPRVLGPTVLGLILLIPAARRSLIRRGDAWSCTRMIGAGVVAVVLGAVLHTYAGPVLPADPMYRAGVADAAPAQTGTATPETSTGEWLNYGNDSAGTRFSALTQITPANVDKLEQVWVAHTQKTPGGMEGTPLKVDRTVYGCTNKNDIYAFDAETGADVWRYDANSDARLSHPTCRGVAYYKAPGMTGPCAERIITNTVDARLIALDAHDGKPCADFGNNGIVSLLTGLGEVIHGYYNVSSAPTISHGKIVLGGHVADGQYWGEPSGVIRAFDAVTGKLAWAWDMGNMDRTGEPPEGETYTRSTPNCWGPMSSDETLGLVFVPTGNATPDYFAAQRRPFDEKYGSAVVALDSDTGKIRWVFQTVHHDVWDYDVAHQPTLVDFPKNGTIVHGLILPTKRGELFVLDRATGEPIYPVEERPVPQDGKAPEDFLSPTQPFAVGTPGFSGPDLVESNMWGLTPLDQLWCRVKFREARYEGPMTPTGPTWAIQDPGYSGGMEWGSASVDITRNIAVINTMYMPTYTRLVPRDEATQRGMVRFTDTQGHQSSSGYDPAQEGTPYGALITFFMSPLKVPCGQPPYGRVNAIDLTTGKLLWSTIFGSAASSGPFGMESHLPLRIGAPNYGGGVVTQSGLFFIGAAQDRFLRVYDTTTGKLLRELPLPEGGNATPITYMSPESGRQFVVIAAAGSSGLQSEIGDAVVAFALPKSLVAAGAAK